MWTLCSFCNTWRKIRRDSDVISIEARPAGEGKKRRPPPSSQMVDLASIELPPAQNINDVGDDVIQGRAAWQRRHAWPGASLRRGRVRYFLAVNRNRRSMTLNLAALVRRKLLAQLMRKADVVINNFKSPWGRSIHIQ
jgi:crotonobetainyl-CoA:carnitine CoA-transferase CaiB-like acyl-CoA transferase